MWPILMQFLRSNAPYLTLPFAAVIGVIGYNLEGYLSDRYTPYNKAIQDQRLDRLDGEQLKDPTSVEKLKYKENVLGKNVSPSLQKRHTGPVKAYSLVYVKRLGNTEVEQTEFLFRPVLSLEATPDFTPEHGSSHYGGVAYYRRVVTGHGRNLLSGKAGHLALPRGYVWI